MNECDICGTACDDQEPTGERQVYECSTCACIGTVQSCETCWRMACPYCLESDKWSSNPQQCIVCYVEDRPIPYRPVPPSERAEPRRGRVVLVGSVAP